ncbi:MAG: phosphotransferase [Pseudomonadales bacterium]|jgi:hypothetical protein|nr:phosphotransferase [Pseudomonadales bacterium]
MAAEDRTAPEIRATPETVTAEWLTAVLHHAGHDGVVAAFEAIRVGTGQVGQNVRFALRYAAGSGPASIVGKFASDDPASRQTGIALQNYLKEVRFYETLQPTLDIRTPTPLLARIDPQTHDFVIMMEDLAPAEQGDQIRGCGADEAAVAVVEAARLHGPRWNDPALAEIEWLGSRDPAEGAASVRGLWDAVFEPFLARYAGRLTEEECALARALGARFDAYVAPRPGPRTVTHGDYRLDNMLFGGPAPLTVVDWQSPGLGNGTADVAYFLGTALEPALRRSIEDALLREYVAVLHGYGIDYDLETCRTDYRRASFAGLVMAVIASMIVGQTDRGDEMFMTMARRSAAMAQELDALSLLS